MTSMGLKKDAHDFKQLQKSDILNIENGNADINDTKSGILARISGIRFQIQNNIDPNGHSLLQRIEYWKTGWQIVKTNWVIGVGTGDTQVAFDKQYDRDNSPLGKENRLRAHNTYLTVWISFGIIGIGLFGWLITFYLKTSLQLNHPLAFVFILIACSTFLIEDTLETQTGVTLFAFFYALLSVKINPYRS
jgi:O-antigen ligase